MAMTFSPINTGRRQGGMGFAGSGRAVGVKVDASHLRHLAAGLGDLREEVSDRVIRSSFKDALGPALTKAKAKTVDRAGYDQAVYKRAPLVAKVKRGMTKRMPGPMQAEIKSLNTWPTMTHWAVNRKPRGNYTSSGMGGVKYQGLFGNSGRIFQRRAAFVRYGANGNMMVFGRQGSARHPLFSYYGPNPSAVMLHEPVQTEVRRTFQLKLDERFVSKYNGAVARIKAKHGL